MLLAFLWRHFLGFTFSFLLFLSVVTILAHLHITYSADWSKDFFFFGSCCVVFKGKGAKYIKRYPSTMSTGVNDWFNFTFPTGTGTQFTNLIPYYYIFTLSYFYWVVLHDIGRRDHFLYERSEETIRCACPSSLSWK